MQWLRQLLAQRKVDKVDRALAELRAKVQALPRLGQAKPWVAIRLGTPRRLFTLHQGLRGARVGAFPAAAIRRRQAGHS